MHRRDFLRLLGLGTAAADPHGRAETWTLKPQAFDELSADLGYGRGEVSGFFTDATVMRTHLESAFDVESVTTGYASANRVLVLRGDQSA